MSHPRFLVGVWDFMLIYKGVAEVEGCNGN